MRRITYKLFLVVLIMLGSMQATRALDIITTVPNLNQCADSISFPITVQNLDNVYTISLKLDYDTNRLSYGGFSNLHPELASGFFSAGAVNGQLGMSWISLTEAEITSDTLVVIHMLYKGGYSDLTWDTLNANNCVYSNLMGTTLPSNFISGSISTQGPYIASDPVDTTVNEGTNAMFTVDPQLSTGVQWQVSQDTGNTWTNISNGSQYSGATTNTLTVINASTAMHTYMYRAEVSGICPNVLSDPAVLSVIPNLATITTSIGNYTFCNGSIAIPVLATNFTDVKEFNLSLDFNDAGNILSYTGYTGVNSALAAGSLTIGSAGNTISADFSASTGISFSQDTLFILEFNASGGSSSLAWDTTTVNACQYINPNGFEFPLQVLDGSVNILVTPQAPGQPSGPVSLCPGVVTSVYSTNAVQHADSYNWILNPSSAGSIQGDSNVVTVSWDPAFSGYTTLTVEAVGVCGSSNASAGLVIAMDSLPSKPAMPTGPNAFCADVPSSNYSIPFIINAQSYEWELSPSNAGTLVTNSTQVTVNWNSSFNGTAYLTARGVNACGDGPYADTLLIDIYPTISVDLGPDQTICVNHSLDLDAGNPGATFFWTTGDTTQVITVDTSRFAIGTHEIVVRATSPNGCLAFDTILVSIDPCVGIDENTIEPAVSLFPNPTKAEVNISVKNWLGEDIQIKVFSVNGSLVYQEAIRKEVSTFTHKLMLEELPQGLYFVQLRSNESSIGKPLIIKK